jgi:hypothetical protein
VAKSVLELDNNQPKITQNIVIDSLDNSCKDSIETQIVKQVENEQLKNLIKLKIPSNSNLPYIESDSNSNPHPEKSKKNYNNAIISIITGSILSTISLILPINAIRLNTVFGDLEFLSILGGLVTILGIIFIFSSFFYAIKSYNYAGLHGNKRLTLQERLKVIPGIITFISMILLFATIYLLFTLA